MSDCISFVLVQPSPAPPYPFSAATQLLSLLIQPCGLKLGAVGLAHAGCAEWCVFGAAQISHLQGPLCF